MEMADFVQDIAYALRDLGANVVNGGDYIFLPDTAGQLRIFFDVERLTFFMTRIELGRTERQYLRSRPGRLPFHVRTVDFLCRTFMYIYECETLGPTKAGFRKAWRYGQLADGEEELKRLIDANVEKILQEQIELRRIKREIAKQQRVSPALAFGTSQRNGPYRIAESPNR